ncbi:alkaline phosphatase [Brevundimonas naejangsanensis]|uniref:Alkaline phosphatase n=1 Tax=Brevundimonas naejangsanensis TaxID=588932 RepID=A0A494RM47_9CAUL|nr:alkaline phosphatase D family protein [Brevundimonas naejangsanensis]AYG95790.1 alkaline phosphatase [Brevundimonas naejangsanensis]
MTHNLRLSRRGALALVTGGAALAGPVAARESVDPAAFTHGLAAGDPTQDGFVIWTRAVGEGSAVALRWEVAEDAGFTRVVQSGTTLAKTARDHTAKVDVTGLHSGREYFYRFHSADAVSPAGRARTLPSGDVERARLAVVSCSHYGFGYFNAYRAIAELEEPVDAVVHLGDYIYEYGVDGYGGPESRALGREHDPAHEILTLDDYRRRFAQYRADPDLQAAHARAAFITVWDDHETANNSWMGGSSAHNEDTEGPWDRRRDAAIQAYFEWLPMRDPAPGRPAHVLNRVYDFGDLLSLIAVETRLTGRTQAPSASREMIFDAEGRPDAARFEAAVLNRPERSMMGATQEAWLEDALTASVQRGTAWQMLANQVIVARMRAPDFMSILPDEMLEEALSRPGSRRWLESTRLGLPINLDAWDGYPAARLRLYDAARRSGANLAVLSGDTHMFWGNRLHDPRDDSFIGVEFGVGSVTSPGGYETISPDPRIYEIAETALVARNPDVRFAHVRDHGFLIVEITRTALRCDYHQVADIKTRDGRATRFACITTDRAGGFNVGEG